MTSGGAGTQTQHPVFTVIITHYPHGLQLGEQTACTSDPAQPCQTILCTLFTLPSSFTCAHRSVFLNLWFFNDINYFNVSVSHCQCTVKGEGMSYEVIHKRYSSHTMCSLCTQDAVYRMTAVAVILAAPRGASCQAMGTPARVIMGEITYLPAFLKPQLRSV